MKPGYGRSWIVAAVSLVLVLSVFWIVAAIQLAVAAAAPVPYRLSLRSNLSADYSQDPPGRQFGWLRVSIVGDVLRDLGLGSPDSWEDSLALALEGEVPTATAINFEGDPPNTATPSKTPQPSRTHTYTPTPVPSATASHTPRPTSTPSVTVPPPTNTNVPAVATPTRTPYRSATPSMTKTPTNTKTPYYTKTPTNTRTPWYTKTPTSTPVPNYTYTPTPRVDHQPPIIINGGNFMPVPGPVEACEFGIEVSDLHVTDPAFSSGIREVKIKYWVNGWSTDYTYSDPFALTSGGATADEGWDGYYTGGVTVKVYDLTPDPIPTAQATQPAGEAALMEYYTIALWAIATDYAGYTTHLTLPASYTVSYSCGGY